jgi:hypothetical protein
MARLLALNAIFFLIPFAVFAIWLYATKRTIGSSAEWTTRTLVVLGSIGAVFVLIGLVVLTISETTTTGENYIPAAIQDGEIVPGRFGDE